MHLSNYENHVSVHPSRLVLYAKYQGERFSRNIFDLAGKEARQRSQGFTRKSASRLKMALEAMVYTAKWKTVFVKSTQQYFRYKINFITLTLPSAQIHSDNVIVKKCLSPFLEAWAKRRPGLLYVWKSEVQDNGNIHFHITSNAFYHYKKLRDNWNRYVENLGYVTRSGLESPNSTDVHSVSKINSLAGYLISYMSKKDRYTRVLKRYHKIYGQRHKASKENVCVLPKNYFNFIKRHVTCILWSASKPLLTPKLQVSFYEKGVELDIAALNSKDLIDSFLKFEHCWMLPIQGAGLSAFPALNKLYIDHFKPVFKKQLENSEFKETIKSL